MIYFRSNRLATHKTSHSNRIPGLHLIDWLV